MPDVGDDGESNGLFIQFLGCRCAPHAPTVFQAGVFCNRPFRAFRTHWKQLAHPLREAIHVLLIECNALLCLTQSAPLARFTVLETCCFGGL